MCCNQNTNFMKKILSLAIALAVVVHVSAKGVEPETPFGVSVIKNGAVVKLFYRGEQSGTVKVAIYNNSGTTVFRETLKNTEDFMRPYDFSKLAAGVYTIELTDEKGVSVRKVTHNISSGKRIAKLTRINKQDHRYVLSVPNQGGDVLKVRIFDQHSNLVHQETDVVNGNFAKLYNLGKNGDNYFFVITDKKGNRNLLQCSNE